MSTPINTEPPLNQLSESAREISRRAADAAIGAAQSATDTAKGLYQSASLKTEDSLVTFKGYVRRNPAPVVLGVFAFGMAIGYMLRMARR